MIAIFSEWAADLSFGPTGDLEVSDAAAEATQRVVRRLMTNPGDYIWQTGYGAGLGKRVGQPYSSLELENSIRRQLLLETAIAATPAPVVLTETSRENEATQVLATIGFHVMGHALPVTATIDFSKQNS